MTTEIKKSEVDSLHELFKTANCAIIAEYRGITAQDLTALRKDLRAAGGKLKVAKNTLARIAAKNTKFEAAEPMLVGPVSIAFGQGADISKPAKAMIEFAKKNEKLKILGGALEGSALDKEAVKKLASMPPKPVLQAMFLGLLKAPARNFVGLLAGAPRKLLYALMAKADKEKAV